MNRTFSFLITATVFLASAPFARASDDCVDLSHVQTWAGGTLVQVKQVGCEKWVRQQYLGNEPLGTPSEITISPSWTSTQVDDQYERYENRQLWTWNRTRTALIHEFAIQTLDKASDENQFLSGSEVYRLTDEGIRRDSVQIVRIERADGSVEVQSVPMTSEVFPKLLGGRNGRK